MDLRTRATELQSLSHANLVRLLLSREFPHAPPAALDQVCNRNTPASSASSSSAAPGASSSRKRSQTEISRSPESSSWRSVPASPSSESSSAVSLVTGAAQAVSNLALGSDSASSSAVAANGHKRARTSAPMAAIPENREDAAGVAMHTGPSKGSPRKPVKRKSKKRSFDMSKYAQRRVALRVAYIGTRYFGFAHATSDPDKLTVEEALFAAMERTCLITDRTECALTRSGRTDKGVSGLGQVISCNLRSNLLHGLGIIPETVPHHVRMQMSGSDADAEMSASADESVKSPRTELDYARMLNRVLPSDIRIVAWAPVPVDFSARFSSAHRSYKYFFFRDDLDTAAMRQAGSMLVGLHDFRNFCKLDAVNVTSFERRVLEFDIQPCEPDAEVGSGGSSNSAPSASPSSSSSSSVAAAAAAASGSASLATAPIPSSADSPDRMYFMYIKGTGFLWHQVRCIASVLFLVGRGLEQPDVVNKLLDVETMPARPQYAFASDMPLVFMECGLNGVQWNWNMENLNVVFRSFHAQYRQLLVQARVVRTFVEDTAHRIARISSSAAARSLWVGSQLEVRVPRPRRYRPLEKRATCATLAEKVDGLAGRRLERHLEVMRRKQEFEESVAAGTAQVSQSRLTAEREHDEQQRLRSAHGQGAAAASAAAAAAVSDEPTDMQVDS